jgi:hypothetical protein
VILAETGPLATSWHSNKFPNPIRDGAVLPVMHLNGYKIANPTILARIPHEELESLLIGYGHQPYFVEGVASEKSIVLSWAVIKWSVQSDRYGDVSMFGLSINSPLDSPPAVPDWSVGSSGATVHGTACIPVKARSDSQAALW